MKVFNRRILSERKVTRGNVVTDVMSNGMGRHFFTVPLKVFIKGEMVDFYQVSVRCQRLPLLLPTSFAFHPL